MRETFSLITWMHSSEHVVRCVMICGLVLGLVEDLKTGCYRLRAGHTKQQPRSQLCIYCFVAKISWQEDSCSLRFRPGHSRTSKLSQAKDCPPGVCFGLAASGPNQGDSFRSSMQTSHRAEVRGRANIGITFKGLPGTGEGSERAQLLGAHSVHNGPELTANIIKEL